MPLTVPAQVRVVYAEANTPGADTGAVPFDAFYDLAQNDITATKDAALAALGLSYGAGIFTALEQMVLSISSQLNVAASPGGADQAFLSAPDFFMTMLTDIANPNTIGNVVSEHTFGIRVGQTFKLQKSCTNVTDTPLTYAGFGITRLV